MEEIKETTNTIFDDVFRTIIEKRDWKKIRKN